MTDSRWPVVLFDLDGTVANTIPLILASYRHAIRQVLDSEVDPEEARSWIGRTLVSTFAERHPDRAAELLTAYTDWNLANLDNLVEDYPGMAELLADLETASIRCGIVTSKRRQSSILTLAAVGLADAVDVLAAMEDSERHKPDPAPLQIALATLDANPSDAVYIGDAAVDMLAARAAGVSAIGVTWGAGTRDELVSAGAGAVVDTIDELRDLVLGAATPQVAYGWWPSPIGIDLLTSTKAVKPAEPRFDGADLYWVEGRPAEAGRCTIMRQRDGEITEVTEDTNVRTRVHEYGGGAWDVRDGALVFSDFGSGRIFRQDAESPHPITPDNPSWRFADLRVHPDRSMVLAVREDHSGAGEPVNTLIALDLDGPNDEGGTVLASGADFYACPELSADGRLAWMEWDHPNMPWDECRVCVATLDARALTASRVVAGGPGESAVHPQWGPDGSLHVLSDRTGFWELYADTAASGEGQLVGLTHGDADLAEPFWVFGRRPYAIDPSGRVVIRPRIDGICRPLQLAGDHLIDPEIDVCDVDSLAVSGDHCAALVEFTDRPAAIIRWQLSGDGEFEVVRSASDFVGEPGGVSVAEAVTWAGDAGGVHGWFYPPANAAVAPLEGTLPPLITLSHGGPTAFSTAGYSLATQFWTSRGFAVLMVNYSGSSGCGRAYRERLRAAWGVLDVADCVAGALAMADQGRVDGGRLAIRGGSAGGYTTLRALTTSDVFAAGVSLYGIGDLSALARDTHKFESRYLDGLVGPWPEAEEVYRERSPINHVEALNTPMLILQGADDLVVPPDQARTMAAAVAARGLPVELIIFDGEGHGFRRADNIRRALEAELAFYQRLFPAPT